MVILRGWKIEDFVKVYWSSVDGPNRRKRPLGRWKDRVKEYVRGEQGEMGCSGQGGSAWIGRGGDPSAMATPLVDAYGGSEASELFTD